MAAAEEKSALSSKDTAFDQIVIEESPALLDQSLADLEAAVVASGDSKAAWAPHSDLETGLGSRLTFLRWAKFDIEKARLRRAVYWEERMALWHDGIITCAGDSMLQTALGLGVSEVALGARDNFGRQVVCVYLPRADYKTGITPRDILRVFWYMQHVAYETESMDSDEQTSRRGIIIVNNMKGMAMANFNKEAGKLILRSLQDVLPIRLRAMHLLHQPWFFSVIWSFISVFLSAKMKQRFELHGANEAALLAHIPKSSIPATAGGDLSWDHQSWLKERISKDELSAKKL